MKKQILNLGQALNKAEQKQIIGGSPAEIDPGSCAWQGGNGYSGVVGVTRDYAEGAHNANGGWWCCQSCCSVGWLSDSHKGYLGCEGYSEW